MRMSSIEIPTFVSTTLARSYCEQIARGDYTFLVGSIHRITQRLSCLLTALCASCRMRFCSVFSRMQSSRSKTSSSMSHAHFALHRKYLNAAIALMEQTGESSPLLLILLVRSLYYHKLVHDSLDITFEPRAPVSVFAGIFQQNVWCKTKWCARKWAECHKK